MGTRWNCGNWIVKIQKYCNCLLQIDDGKLRICCLVGGWPTPLKNIKSMGRIIPYIMEIKPYPTYQSCRGEGEGRKDKGCGGGSRSKTSCMWRVVRDKVVCERWCATKKMVYVTKFCVKDRVCESCVWKIVCDKAVCERWCVAKEQCAGSQDAM